MSYPAGPTAAVGDVGGARGGDRLPGGQEPPAPAAAPEAAGTAGVRQVRVDDDGVHAVSDAEVVLDVLFDERRIWSFHLHRDGRGPWPGAEGHDVAWPIALRRFLEGTTRVQLVEHVSGRVAHDAETTFGHPEDDRRVAVVNEQGLPLGIDKSLRLAQTFDTRDPEQVAPLLDALEEVIDALHRSGLQAFPAYGTLLGAVREGALIGHDSDADIGYVSEHAHPVDVIRESFAIQRSLADMGYAIVRYSGAAFRVDVEESDGSVRGLDVFGGFMRDDRLYLMGEIGTPFRRDWVLPLGTTTLEGRTLPAPADTERFLTATYGPSWRVPDPAYVFSTPAATHRRLNGWFRGTRVRRADWDRTYAALRLTLPDLEPSPFAHWVHRQHGGVPARLVDLGCGRGVDALWFATQGSRVLGLDYVGWGSEAVASVAAERGLSLELDELNLCETRSVMVQSARVAREPGFRVVTARHLADATDEVGRHNLWRVAELMVRPGGRFYLEFLINRGRQDPFARTHFLRTLPPDLVERELVGTGATMLSRRVEREDQTGRRSCWMAVEWPR